MLAELMRKHGGIKPIEGKIAAMDHFHERIEHVGFLSGFVLEAEMVLTFGQGESFDLIGHATLFQKAIYRPIQVLSTISHPN